MKNSMHRRVCGAPRTLILMLLGIATVISVEPAMAQDSWANTIINEMKSAEKQIANERVRVASLGGVETTSAPARKLRSASIAREDSPQSSPPEKKTRVAALTNRASDAEKPSRSLSGGSVNWLKSASCLDSTLRSVVTSLASKFGPVTVNSTCRNQAHNRRVGGASKSYHLSGDAVDFRIHSNISAAYASLRSNGNVGGLKHYGGGLFHIDTGPRRSW